VSGQDGRVFAWRPFLEAYRTLCVTPPEEIRSTFEAFRRNFTPCVGPPKCSL
jgi:hypothetical protein